MSTPSAPSSPGFPLLDPAANQALHAARARVDAMTGRGPQLPTLSTEEREEALKDAATATCTFCAGFHPGASTPACPRLATFKLNGDGNVVEGSFWPDGITDASAEVIGDDGKTKAVFHLHGEWDTSKVVFAADAAEEPREAGEPGE